jgi:uncharacterized radical SAM superfamily Fe-S cluster-containing enzyme
LIADHPIYPLPDHSDGPIEGEDVLAAMLHWAAKDREHGPSFAGLIELNWAARADLGLIYDRVSGSRPQPLSSLTVAQATEMLAALESGGATPQMIYFTGADPAGHPQLGDFVTLARQKGINYVGLQCSGPRLAHDDQLIETLVRLRPLLFVEFDGFDETASLILHGRRDLPFEARRGLDRLASAGLQVTLLAGVTRGVNLQEVGAIAAFALKHPAVFSAIFRPAPPRLGGLTSGPAGHVTAAGIMTALEQQSNGLFGRDAFAPALCCRPERHFVAQVPYPGQDAAPIGPAAPNRKAHNGCRIGPGGSSCFWLGVHEFMTPWSHNLHQARHCPLVIMTPDGRTIPYCLAQTTEES